MDCIYCNRQISNIGSLTAHQQSCKLNPNRISHNHSPKAGQQKGCKSWNKGKTFKVKNSVILVESGEYKNRGECTIRKHVKRYLIYKNGHFCEICKNSVWNNKPIPLVCDHIDGDYSNSELSNFRLICCNCDAQTDTYKSKNNGHGRGYDREYRRKQSQ